MINALLFAFSVAADDLTVPFVTGSAKSQQVAVRKPASVMNEALIALLAREHSKYGVEAYQYVVMADCFLAAMQKCLGSAWSKNNRMAWTRIWNSVLSVALPAAVAAERNQKVEVRIGMLEVFEEAVKAANAPTSSTQPDPNVSTQPPLEEKVQKCPFPHATEQSAKSFHDVSSAGDVSRKSRVAWGQSENSAAVVEESHDVVNYHDKEKAEEDGAGAAKCPFKATNNNDDDAPKCPFKASHPPAAAPASEKTTPCATPAESEKSTGSGKRRAIQWREVPVMAVARLLLSRMIHPRKKSKQEEQSRIKTIGFVLDRMIPVQILARRMMPAFYVHDAVVTKEVVKSARDIWNLILSDQSPKYKQMKASGECEHTSCLGREWIPIYSTQFAYILTFLSMQLL
jgi:hypothetical protein